MIAWKEMEQVYQVPPSQCVVTEEKIIKNYLLSLTVGRGVGGGWEEEGCQQHSCSLLAKHVFQERVI